MPVKYKTINIFILFIVFLSLPNILFAVMEIGNTIIFSEDSVTHNTFAKDTTITTSEIDSLTENVADPINVLVNEPSDSISNNLENPIVISPIVQPEPQNPTIKLKTGIADTVFDFNLTTDIHYKIIDQFRTPEGKENFIKGWETNEKLNQLLNQIDEFRNQYTTTTSSAGKEKIANKVMELESLQMEFKANCDNFFMKARALEQNFWSGASEEEMQKLNIENDSISKVEIEKLLPKPETKPIEIETDTLALSTIDSISTNEPIIKPPVNEPNINLVTYKIQIGSFSNGLPAYVEKLYKKLSVLRKIDHYIDEKGITVYTIGEVTSVSDAAKLQNQIRQEGVNDAFVIAIFNGKRITLKEAKELNGK